MYGKFLNYLDKDYVDVDLSFKWMKHTGLKGELKYSSQQYRIRH